MTTSRPSRTSLRSPPVGTRLPGSVHAITCSIPTMRDVIGYEEKDPETMRSVTAGYPRFVTHFYIRRIVAWWSDRFQWEGREIFIAASEGAAREAAAFSGEPDATLFEEEGIWAVHFPGESPGAERAKAFLRHTGGSISSRRAEQYLLRHGLITATQHEERADIASAETEVRQRVGELFGAPPENVLLASSGMNAFYAVFRAINALQEQKGRSEWIQLGWLYVDTIEVLRKLGGGKSHVLHDVLDPAALEKLLEERGDRVAGIVTEAPTNPLMQTPDLVRLRELATRFHIPLVVDPSLASPFNLDVLPFCDVAINSLTKYAASAGDVMMGAAVFNPASPLAAELSERVGAWLLPPFAGDLERLAFEIGDYERVMTRINGNTVALTDFLQRHPSVERVYGAYSGESGKNYTRLERRPASPGGIVTILLRQPIQEFYDRVQVPKGPSFGTTFTLLCPFLYLAHYDLVSTEAGRRQLKSCNLDPDLVRISVGIEDIGEITAAFNEAL